MTRLFTDGAESGNTLSLYPFQNNWDVSSSIKRSGSYSYKEISSGAAWINVLVNDLTEIYVRFAFYPNSYQSGYNHYFMQIFDNGQCLLNLAPLSTTTGQIGIYLNTTLIGSGDAVMNTNTWHLVEVYYKIHSTEGAIKIRVNGILDYSFAGNTVSGGKSKFNKINIGCNYGNYCVWYFDDIAVNDTNGVVDNSWCGDGHVIALVPNANGDSSDLVGSDGNSTDNYALVDDIPNDGDTTYVESATGDDYDLYNLTASGLGATHVIKRVWVESIAKDTTTAGGQIKHVLKTNSTEYDSSAISLGTAYALNKSAEHTVNPQTGSAWTPAELDALQVGVKIVA